MSSAWVDPPGDAEGSVKRLIGENLPARMLRSTPSAGA